ncbi:hypothetical protein [Sphingomonas sp. M1-B02]|uniref:hypothetical protein n=1 Tax=Sphingomonas sp. M1-B02 TaxID=3114300 RepID=UPI00223EE6FB|nr:hypothetical protein [Sphingomonas sp. S6-11]UZK67508.1 hypothetical protein OKW87_06680 [Sphingomonas sp. S6-11]
MTRLPLLTGLCALALLAGCDATEPSPNPVDDVTSNEAPEIIAPVPAATAVNLSSGTGDAMPALNLAPDGVSVVLDSGSARHATFGMEQALATQIVEASLGNPMEEGDSQDCGAGPLSFASFRGGLTLYFQEAKFAGWDVDGRDGGKFATANGIGIGSTRTALEAAGPLTVEDSSIGIEFVSGEMSGLLSSRAPEGTVTNIWAGVNCIAR